MRLRITAMLVALTLAATIGLLRIDVVALASHHLRSSDALVSSLDAPPRFGQPSYVLVVVTDERSASAEPGVSGRLGGERADSVVLFRIDATIAGLSIPRDLLVESPSTGPVSLAALLEFGGRADLVGAVRETTGLPVHHYVELGFPAIAALVDASGGLDIAADGPLRDVRARFSYQPGDGPLTGDEAVAYLRGRSIEQLQDGEWRLVESGDADRVARQQAAVVGLVTSSSAGELWSLFQSVRPHVYTDASLDAWSLGRLGRRTLGAGDGLRWHVLPTEVIRPLSERISPLGPSHLGGFRRSRLAPPDTVMAVLSSFSDGDARGSAGGT